MTVEKVQTQTIAETKNGVFWDVKSQKTSFFIVTAVKTSNLT
jgi:hypothetical protein